MLTPVYTQNGGKAYCIECSKQVRENRTQVAVGVPFSCQLTQKHKEKRMMALLFSQCR